MSRTSPLVRGIPEGGWTGVVEQKGRERFKYVRIGLGEGGREQESKRGELKPVLRGISKKAIFQSTSDLSSSDHAKWPKRWTAIRAISRTVFRFWISLRRYVCQVWRDATQRSPLYIVNNLLTRGCFALLSMGLFERNRWTADGMSWQRGTVDKTGTLKHRGVLPVQQLAEWKRSDVRIPLIAGFSSRKTKVCVAFCRDEGCVSKYAVWRSYFRAKYEILHCSKIFFGKEFVRFG